jgi:hypothetical protein
LLKWPFAGLALVGLLAGAYEINRRMRDERAREATEDKVASPDRAGKRIVKLGKLLAKSHGIKDEPAQQVDWYPRVTVYGRVVPNPQATVEIRSPFAGTLRTAAEKAWLTTGRWIDAGQVFGRIDIRASPQERLDIQAKLAEARAKQSAADDVLEIQQERLNRFSKVVSTTQAIAQYDLDNARVLVAEARGQAAVAKTTVDLWQKALDMLERRGDRPLAPWIEPLTTPAEGEVIDVSARPDTAVEAGGLIARVVDFRRPWVRLELPPELLADGTAPSQVDLFATQPKAQQLGTTKPENSSGPIMPAALVGPAGQVDATSQLAGYWYEVDLAKKTEKKGEHSNKSIWRPGLFVQAAVNSPKAKPVQAVSVPHEALLFHMGRTLVYVRVGPGRYERREVSILGREKDRWVVSAGVAAEEPVVSRQAQVLLSEEFKPRNEMDND